MPTGFLRRPGENFVPLLSETGKTLVIQRIAQEQEKNLKVLGQNLKRHGAVTKMKSLVSELMQYQVTGEDLELWGERAKTKPLLALKLQDIRCIYQAFEEYLRDSYVTPKGFSRFWPSGWSSRRRSGPVKFFLTVLWDLRRSS